MYVQRTTWSHVESILDHLSAQHREEYAADVGDMDEVRRVLRDFMARGGEASTLFFDGIPQAMLAIAHTPFGPMTWLACTQDYFDKGGIAAIRQAKRHMADAVKRLGPITSFVGSKHPDAVRWMYALGAVEKPSTSDAKIFLFA